MGGYADGALSFPMTLLMSLINAGQANQQYQSGRDTNIQGLNTFLDAMQNSVGQPGSSGRIRIPELGIDTALPVTNMLGKLQDYGREGTRRMERDNWAAANDYNQYAKDVTSRAQGLESRFAPESQKILGQFTQAGNDIVGGYQQRYNRGMANLEGAGAQEQQDIQDAYGRANAASIADLTSRGLGNSTLLADARRGNTREMTADMGRLKERLRGERLAADASLSGDVLNAQDANRRSIADMQGSDMSYRAGLAGNVADAQNQLDSGRISMLDSHRRGLTDWQNNIGNQVLNYQNAANSNALNAITGSNFGYPDNTWLSVNQALGSGSGNLATQNHIENLQHTQLAWSKFGAIMNPFASIGGSMAGGYMGGLGFGKGLAGGGGGAQTAASLGTP